MHAACAPATPPGTGVTNGCELPCGNRTWDLCKSSTCCSEPQSSHVPQLSDACPPFCLSLEMIVETDEPFLNLLPHLDSSQYIRSSRSSIFSWVGGRPGFLFLLVPRPQGPLSVLGVPVSLALDFSISPFTSRACHLATSFKRLTG